MLHLFDEQIRSNTYDTLDGKADSRRRYDDFVRQLAEDDFRAFFAHYPVLAQLTAQAVDFWIEASEELMTRLEADLSDIQAAFANGTDPGTVIHIETDLCDPHQAGRTVMALKFTSDLRLVYKPRPVSAERFFTELLTWCNEQGRLLPFKPLKVLDRGSYGWIEYVHASPCRSEEDVYRFYRRAGMLLCLTYVLHGTDFHAGNLIAAGEHPTLIDLETLLQPRLVSGLYGESNVTAGDTTRHSVRKTGLLPGSASTAGGCEAGGMARVGGETGSLIGKAWSAVNTDAMTLSYEPVVSRSCDNLPILEGRTIGPHEYAEAVVRGFEDVYRFLVRKRLDLLATDGPLHAMADLSIRVVLRPTTIYRSVIDASLQPRLLHERADRTSRIAAMGRSRLQDSRLQSLFLNERRDLEQLDVPRFEAPAGENALKLGDGTQINDCFEKAPYQLVLDTLEDLGEEDLKRQKEIIRAALATGPSRTSRRTPVGADT